MPSIITLAGEQLFAAKAQANEALDIDTFIFANVPGQDPTDPIERTETIPAVEQQVHTQAVQQVGRINDNVVVYSTVLDSVTGPFDFNWVGLYSSANDTLVAINHIPTTSKIETNGGESGNTLNRNFGIEYSGIADLTGITVEPETWQLDFTARLAGMDELTRNLAMDLNGKDSFIDDGFKIEARETVNTFKVLPGVGYASGLRIEQENEHILTITEYPKFVYVDAYFDGDASSTWKPQHSFTVSADELTDYVDGNGKNHHLVKLAEVTAADEVEDLRLFFTLNNSTRCVNNESDLSNVDHDYIYYVKSKRGFYSYDESITLERINADADELEYINAPVGAWVRVNLSDNEKGAIYKANAEKLDINSIREYESKKAGRRAFGQLKNLNSTSEDLNDAHYAKDAGVTIVADDFIEYNGIKLQRITTPTFASSLRDTRAADYPLEVGKRYIVSAYVCAPFRQTDSQGINEDFNRFIWMRAVTNATSFGHGAKLIGTKPRRIWSVVEASSTTEWRVIKDPSVELSSEAGGGQDLRFLFDGFGLGGSIAGKDVYIGGIQIEEAPNQTEKQGVAVIGTSIDTTTSSLQNWTQERSWPRYLEGLLCAPVFNGAIGGQFSDTLVARFDADVAVWGINAKYCILAANVNDFMSGFDSQNYRANWLSMYNKAIAAGMIPIFLTPPRRSVYDYENGAADIEVEAQYIKDTYPFVIDRDEVWQDPFNKNLLRADLEIDGIHPLNGRELAFLIFNKYRDLFTFENMPSAYQKNEFDNSKTQSHGEAVWLNRVIAARTDSEAATALRDSDNGGAPMVIFEAALSAAVTYQLPCANYQKPEKRTNTDIQLQTIRNATTGGFGISIQYYKRDESNNLSAVGASIGEIPNGECWTIATDGDSAWRVN